MELEASVGFSEKCQEAIDRACGSSRLPLGIIPEKLAAGEEVDFEYWSGMTTGWASIQRPPLRPYCDQITKPREPSEFDRAFAEVEKVRDEVLQFIEAERANILFTVTFSRASTTRTVIHHFFLLNFFCTI